MCYQVGVAPYTTATNMNLVTQISSTDDGTENSNNWVKKAYLDSKAYS